MRAVCWHGPRDVRVEQVPDPEILNPRDAIVRVTLTAICGSDLHLWNGLNPTMQAGDVLGHEFMGEVAEVGRAREAYQMWNDKDDDCTKIVLDRRPAIASDPGSDW